MPKLKAKSLWLKKGSIIQQFSLLWIMDWGGSKTLHISVFWCVIKDILNVFTKLQPISDIYKGKKSLIHLLFTKKIQQNFLKTSFRKIWVFIFWMFKSELFRIHNSSFLTHNTGRSTSGKQWLWRKFWFCHDYESKSQMKCIYMEDHIKLGTYYIMHRSK